MYAGVIRRLSSCAGIAPALRGGATAIGGLVVLLSGCALIGYDLAPGSGPSGGAADGGADISGAGGANRAGRGGTGGATSTGMTDGGGDSGSGGSGSGTGGNGAGDGGAGPDTDGGVTSGDGGLASDPCPGAPIGTPDCSHLDDGCEVGICVAGVGCDREPVENGTACGPEHLCYRGICRFAETCLPDASCDYDCGGVPCRFICSGANDCVLGCESGSDCDVDCVGTTNCRPTCEAASCYVDCTRANNCQVTCAAGASCHIECDDSENCDAVVCEGDAACMIECGDNRDNCGFESCSGSIQQCDQEIIVCNRECP
jgi:hypothetical protein